MCDICMHISFMNLKPEAKLLVTHKLFRKSSVCYENDKNKKKTELFLVSYKCSSEPR